MVDRPSLMGRSTLWVFVGTTLTIFGAVSKGATLTDRCLDGQCDSFRRAGLPVHEVTTDAVSAETLWMRIAPSHGVGRDTDKSQVGVTRFDASSCLRSSFGAMASRRCPFWIQCTSSLRSTGCHLDFGGTL